MPFELRAVPFEQMPGWSEDDPTGLFSAMDRARNHIEQVKPYRTGSLGLTAAEIAAAFAAATAEDMADPAHARLFFERNFTAFRVTPQSGQGQVTAFYEPEVEVADSPSDRYRYPFHRRPDDLVDIDDTNRPAGFDPAFAFGRRTEEGITYHPDRQAIDSGFLDGRGLEIAWARSKVDVFFAHVQGAARLRYPDGSLKRITYAAKTGHAFSGIGRHLVSLGEIEPAAVSMDAIRDWLARHPERRDEILWHNRSYIFFREAAVEDPLLGPVAAAKVPLEPMRSIAVDRLIHTFGSLFYIHAPSLIHLTDGQPFGRLMIAQDTGSAIIGPARADIFTGSGEEAGHRAGNVNAPATFFLLVPNSAASRFG